MKNLYYLRDDATGKITTTDDIIEWGKAFESSNRTIMSTNIGSDIIVSTVFLGMNHNFFCGDPILFETMVFGGPLDGEQDRYQTEEQAREGHDCMVSRVRESLHDREEYYLGLLRRVFAQWDTNGSLDELMKEVARAIVESRG